MENRREKCRHENARFYGVQKLGSQPAITLYNCPDCKSTVTEQHLFELREAEPIENKLAVA